MSEWIREAIAGGHHHRATSYSASVAGGGRSAVLCVLSLQEDYGNVDQAQHYGHVDQAQHPRVPYGRSVHGDSDTDELSGNELPPGLRAEGPGPHSASPTDIVSAYKEEGSYLSATYASPCASLTDLLSASETASPTSSATEEEPPVTPGSPASPTSSTCTTISMASMQLQPSVQGTDTGTEGLQASPGDLPGHAKAKSEHIIGARSPHPSTAAAARADARCRILMGRVITGHPCGITLGTWDGWGLRDSEPPTPPATATFRPLPTAAITKSSARWPSKVQAKAAPKAPLAKTVARPAQAASSPSTAKKARGWPGQLGVCCTDMLHRSSKQVDRELEYCPRPRKTPWACNATG
jgi:hypothetical protein